MKKYCLAIVLASLALTGCVEQQLKLSTDSLIPTLETIKQKQIVDNLARYLLDPNAVPVQVCISGGGVQIANQVQPSFAFPFHGWMGNQASVQLQGQLTENWAIQPVNDPDDMRRLRALYRYATGKTDFTGLTKEYPQVFTMAPNGDAKPHPNFKLPQFNPASSPNVCPSSFVSLDNASPFTNCLGCYEGHTVWATSRTDFDNFAMFVFAATPNTTSAGQGGGKPSQPILNVFQ
jgi:hypothetical protein